MPLAVGFRGLIASASLKPVSVVLPFIAPERIPRLDCLGLIEAPTIYAAFNVVSRFRGLIASASLKLRRRGAER